MMEVQVVLSIAIVVVVITLLIIARAMWEDEKATQEHIRWMNKHIEALQKDLDDTKAAR